MDLLPNWTYSVTVTSTINSMYDVWLVPFVSEIQKQLLDEIKQLKERNQELENRMETLESERNVDDDAAAAPVTSATWSQLNDNTCKLCNLSFDRCAHKSRSGI